MCSEEEKQQEQRVKEEKVRAWLRDLLPSRSVNHLSVQKKLVLEE